MMIRTSARGRGIVPRMASALRAAEATTSPSQLAEITRARWIFLMAGGYIFYVTFAGGMLKEIGSLPWG